MFSLFHCRCKTVFSIFLLFSFFSTLASAQHQGNFQRGGGGGHFKEADRDGDGKISANEFWGPPRVFKKLDVNRDGYLTRDELPSGPGGGKDQGQGEGQGRDQRGQRGGSGGNVAGNSENFEINVSGTPVTVVVGTPAGVGAKTPLVIYHHGLGKEGMQKYEIPELAKIFAQRGYLFWAPLRQAGGKLQDALAIGQEIFNRAVGDPRVDAGKIVIIGFSQGSLVTFKTAFGKSGIQAVCLLGFGSPVNGGMKIEDGFSSLNLPSLNQSVSILIAGSDEMADPRTAEILIDLIHKAGKTVNVKKYPGYKHDDLCGNKPYLQDLLGFLK